MSTAYWNEFTLLDCDWNLWWRQKCRHRALFCYGWQISDFILFFSNLHFNHINHKLNYVQNMPFPFLCIVVRKGKNTFITQDAFMYILIIIIITV